MADITQCVTSSPSSTQQRSINTPTATHATSSRSTLLTSGTLTPDSTHRIVSSPASVIVSTPTTLSGLEYLPTPIPNPEAWKIWMNPLQIRAPERNQWQTQWQLQLQAVSTLWSAVSSRSSMQQFDHYGMMQLLFGTGRLMEHAMWHRLPWMCESNLVVVHYAMRRIAKALAEAHHSQLIGNGWNTSMQQNNISSIAFELCKKMILKEGYGSNSPCWILQAQTRTRFENKLTKLTTISYSQQETT